MLDEHGIDIKIPVDVVGADYFSVPPSGDVLVNPEATIGLAKVFHVLGMSDKGTMSSTCFEGNGMTYWRKVWLNVSVFTGD